MSEFEKWFRRNWKDYYFTKWQKDFGKRLVGKYDAGSWRTDRIVLIHHFTERKPTIDDFAVFLKDAERFYDQYEGDYHIDGIYLVIHEEYDKKAFRLLLNNTDEDLRDLIKIKMFETIPEQLGERPHPLSNEQRKDRRKKIFIVHGRDKTPALELARLIEKRYPIDTIFLEEKAHQGRTLIEKLEDYSNVDFAIITITPDDLGALKGEKLKERGRQNVIFELGQFIGKIGRKKVCLLLMGDIEIPSGLQGIGYCRFRDSAKECFVDVENELRDANLI